jgi:hypothetical protein
VTSQEATGSGQVGGDDPAPGESNQTAEREPEAVADESTPSVDPGASLPDVPEAPVTEKPVAQQRGVVQYVVSVDESTGLIVKVEKQDEEGTPKELSEEEYLAAFAYASYAAPYYAAYTSSLYDPLSTPAGQAYLKAVIDVWKSLAA